MAWAFLTLSILTEIAATLALRAISSTTGTARAGLVSAAVVGYTLAFLTLALALRAITVGPAYAIWSGCALVGVALGGWLLFAERLSPLTMAGIAVVLLGVIMINFGGVEA